MASRNLDNGTPPSFLSTHSQLPPQQQAGNPDLGHDVEPLSSRQPPQEHSTTHLTHNKDEGETTSRQVAAWSPAALLNPKAAISSQHLAPVPSPVSSRAPSNGTNSTNNIATQFAFHFSSPNDTPTFRAQPPQPSMTPDARTPRSSTPNGMSTMIERMNNVQDRSSVPMAKRRRIEEDLDDQTGQNGFNSNGSSGMLSEYVKQKRQDGQEAPSATSQSQTTVDLTGGTWRPHSSGVSYHRRVANCSQGMMMMMSLRSGTRETKKSVLA